MHDSACVLVVARCGIIELACLCAHVCHVAIVTHCHLTLAFFRFVGSGEKGAALGTGIAAAQPNDPAGVYADKSSNAVCVADYSNSRVVKTNLA